MPELIDPTTDLRTSFLAAVAEFRTDHDYPTPWFVNDVDPPALADSTAFASYVTRVLSERDEAAGRPDWFVPMTTLWWVKRDQMLGRLAIRHRLTPPLEKTGGHIGYDVRPSSRRRVACQAYAVPVDRLSMIADQRLECLWVTRSYPGVHRISGHIQPLSADPRPSQ